MVSRRRVLAQLTGCLAALAVWPRLAAAQPKTSIVVYKDRSCGCCGKWVEHMDANGFKTSVIDGDIAAIHTRYKVDPNVQSCHTAIVGSYLIEGHVPAVDVKALLVRKPAGILGLTIPGMPPSAPGMDVLPFQPYTVLTFDAQGRTTVFARHTKPL